MKVFQIQEQFLHSSREMSELIAKGETKNIVLDYFGLERGVDEKPVDDGNVVCLTHHQPVVSTCI